MDICILNLFRLVLLGLCKYRFKLFLPLKDLDLHSLLGSDCLDLWMKRLPFWSQFQQRPAVETLQTCSTFEFEVQYLAALDSCRPNMALSGR